MKLKCPNCNYAFDGHTCITGDDDKLNDGDISICFNCGEVSKLKNGKLEAIDIKDFPKETKTLIERTNILLEYARNEK